MKTFQSSTARWIGAIALAGVFGSPLAGRAQRHVPTGVLQRTLSSCTVCPNFRPRSRW